MRIAASAATRICGRSASFTPGSRTRAIRKPGMVYGRVGFVDGMASHAKDDLTREQVDHVVTPAKRREAGIAADDKALCATPTN